VIAADLARQGRELARLLDEAHQYYDEKVEAVAQAEQDYRRGRHEAHVRCPGGTVDEKKAWVDADTSDLRFLRDIAAGHVKGGLELIRTQRQKLSYLQTWANYSKEEAAFSRTGPECTP
jgi:hypothetical protein